MIVDLSSYQRGFDFQAFKAGGGLGVILKAAEGESWRDPCYHDFHSKAAAAGLPVATYHFIRATAGGGEAQAKCLMAYAGFDHGERVIVDWEDRAVPYREVLAFLETVRMADLTLQLTVYGSPYFLQEMLFRQATSWLRANTSLWLAEYNTALFPSKVPMVWPTWSLWQYSQSGHVPGFSGPVDLSRFNGPDSKALSWFGVPEPAHAPAIADGPTGMGHGRPGHARHGRHDSRDHRRRILAIHHPPSGRRADAVLDIVKQWGPAADDRPDLAAPWDLSRFNGPDSKALSWFGVPEPAHAPAIA